MNSTGCSKEQVEDIALITCTVLALLRCHLNDSSLVSEVTSGVANLIISLKVTRTWQPGLLSLTLLPTSTYSHSAVS